MTESGSESAPSIEPDKKGAAFPVAKQAPAAKPMVKATAPAGSAPTLEKAAAPATAAPAATKPAVAVKPVSAAAKPAAAVAAKPAAAAAKPPEAKPLEYLPASIGPGQVVIARDQIYGKPHAIEFDPKKAPVRPVEPNTDGLDRRAFISALGVGWFAFSAATAGSLAMLQRFMFPNVLFEPPQSFKAGFPEEYAVGEVSERWKEKFGVWIVRNTEELYVLSTVCTHLGCTPNWLPNEGKFKCPCHGSGFRKTGINFEGPAPRPLERYKITLAEDGQILIDKTKRFQQEKGEWDNPESYLRA